MLYSISVMIIQLIKRFNSNNLPDDIAALFAKGEVGKSNHMSLGKNGSFVFSYQPKAGSGVGSRVTSNGIPKILHDWLYEKNSRGDSVRAFSKLNISLGPGEDSFWATDGSSCKWNNLPAQLQTALDANLKDGRWTDTPRILSLGFGGDYVMITGRNAASWRLDHYKSIDTFFDSIKANGTMALNHVRI